jgi:putative glutamine amidotransferase
MKKALIAPKYSEPGYIPAQIAYQSLSDFMHERGILPIISSIPGQSFVASEIDRVAESYIAEVDALILQGGSDVSPSLYDQDNYYSKGVVEIRDKFEMLLIKHSLNKKIPIFGICRGMQLINVYFGGTINQDLGVGEFIKHNFDTAVDCDNFPKLGNLLDHHKIKLNEDGILFDIFRKTEFEVNSFHHQGISILGESLKVEAKSNDGLIEAIYSSENKVLAVQWHPELNFNDFNTLIFNRWLEWI